MLSITLAFAVNLWIFSFHKSVLAFRRLFKSHCFQQVFGSPSDSPKCLSFGHWLTLCTLKIYLLAGLLTYLVICCVADVRRRVWRTLTSTTGDSVMWRGLAPTNSNTWISSDVQTEKAPVLSLGNSLSTPFSRPVREGANVLTVFYYLRTAYNMHWWDDGNSNSVEYTQ